jgi:hypothetical protein
MSLSVEPGLYLRIEELKNGPLPLPLANGFSLDTAYRALGIYNPSETSDAYFIFANDRDEIWFICNRHLRAVSVQSDYCALRLSLSPALSLAVESRPIVCASTQPLF